MSCNVYSIPHEYSSPRFAKAFALGCNGTVLEKYIGGDWAGFPSPANWKDVERCIAEGNTLYYGDKGYFLRDKYFRVTKNAPFHTGEGYSDGSRFRRLGINLSNNKQGDNIILCPQTDHFFSRFGLTQHRWLTETIQIIKEHSDRPIIIHHKRDLKPLSAFLKNAWTVVSFSSNSSLEALLHGIPAFCTGKSHMERVTLSDLSRIERPIFPENLYQHCCVLADNQWTLEEISQGLAWRKLNDQI
jgi:hypothetical protein